MSQHLQSARFDVFKIDEKKTEQRENRVNDCEMNMAGKFVRLIKQTEGVLRCYSFNFHQVLRRDLVFLFSLFCFHCFLVFVYQRHPMARMIK